MSEEVLALNAEAMLQLKQACSPSVIRLLNAALEQALDLPESTSKSRMLSITYNNLGCYYQKAGDLTRGLNFLQKSLDFRDKTPEHAEEAASTLLNMSSIYAESGDHREALTYALSALDLLRTHFEASPEILTSLIVAYYKVGKAHEAIGETASAFKHYQKGYWLSLENTDSKGIVTLRAAMERTKEDPHRYKTVKPTRKGRYLQQVPSLKHTRSKKSPSKTRTLKANSTTGRIRMATSNELRGINSTIRLARNRLDIARLEIQYLTALKRQKQLERSG